MNPNKFHPYPGLRAFERSESRLFFGRQQQIFDILERLKSRHFLAVLGTSGSGKSSLMKAGVLPSLAKGYMGEIGARWSIAEMKPSDQPFVRLAEALLDDPIFKQAWNPNNDRATASLTAELRGGWRSFHELLAHHPLPDGTKLLLLVDQFEELFRFRTQAEDQAAAFVALLLEACTHPDIYVAITMRSDFLGAAAEFHNLPEMINDGLYLTPRLTRDQLRAAISTPALQFDGEVEEPLINHLLNEASNDPDQLPLLQHALMRLWENSDDGILKFADFDGMNGLKGALDGHAELAFAELDAAQQRIAEILFRALTERAGDGQDIRRPISVQAALELIAVRPEPLSTVRPELVEGQITVAQSPSTSSGRTEHWDALVKVIDTFRLSGRNFLMPPPNVPLTLDTVLDISHESLIRQWVRLSNWVCAESDSAAMYLRLVDAALNNRELWHGTDLDFALFWQNQNKPSGFWAARYNKKSPFAHKIDLFSMSMGFLSNSQAAETKRLADEENHRQAELKRMKRQRVYLLSGFLAAAILTGWALKAENTARKSQILTVKVTLDNLIKQKAGIVSYLQSMIDQGQRVTLLAMLQPLLESSPSLNAQQKQDWEAKLPNLTTERLSQFVRLLFAEKVDKKPNPADFATLAQEVAMSLPTVSANEPDMLKIPAGQFIMGCQDGRDSDCYDDEKLTHPVQIAAFELGKYEVTQAQWQAVMGDNPSYFQDCGGDCAVEQVSWDRVQDFIQRLNAKTGQHYRLPSEAEWEYACRAGKDTNYCGGNEVYAVAWYETNGDRHTHAVGHKQPNAWGLHDMSGDVWEWMQDTPHATYANAPSDGSAWIEGGDNAKRVLRGGSWNSDPQNVRAAIRYINFSASYWDNDVGFRLARTLP
ncbi:MAG: SUMF1/EgtB/PvdO family nonheme iron enzyme [Gallionella sp.]|nr:SUMF1/EgtB/PvdO family nonheme iron enzyme [Gallionella sp.]